MQQWRESNKNYFIQFLEEIFTTTPLPGWAEVNCTNTHKLKQLVGLIV